MGLEAGVDEGVFHRLGVENRDRAVRLLERGQLGGRMIGAFLAEVRVLGAAHRRRHPHAALLVEHGIVVVHLGVVELLLTPIGRRPERLVHGRVSRSKPFRGVCIADRSLEIGDGVRLRIQDRDDVGRIFGRAEDRTIGIDGRIPAVRGDQVVQILLRVAPIPRGNHDVALESLRPPACSWVTRPWQPAPSNPRNT